MSRHLLLFLLLALTLAGPFAGTAEAQPETTMANAYDFTIKVNGIRETVTVVRDALDEKQYWYLPSRPYLVERGGEPVFALVRYQGDDKATQGGVMQMSVNLALPGDAFQDLETKLKSKFGADVKLSPLGIYDCRIFIMNPKDGGKMIAQAEQDDGITTSFVNAEIPFTVFLTQLGADLYADLCSNNTGLQIGVTYKYPMVTPKCGFKLTADWNETYKHLSMDAAAQMSFAAKGVGIGVSADYQRVRDFMNSSKGMKLEAISGQAWKDADMERAINAATTIAYRELFENAVIKEETPAKVDMKDVPDAQPMAWPTPDPKSDQAKAADPDVAETTEAANAKEALKKEIDAKEESLTTDKASYAKDKELNDQELAKAETDLQDLEKKLKENADEKAALKPEETDKIEANTKAKDELEKQKTELSDEKARLEGKKAALAATATELEARAKKIEDEKADLAKRPDKPAPSKPATLPVKSLDQAGGKFELKAKIGFAMKDVQKVKKGSMVIDMQKRERVERSGGCGSLIGFGAYIQRKKTQPEKDALINRLVRTLKRSNFESAQFILPKPLDATKMGVSYVDMTVSIVDSDKKQVDDRAAAAQSVRYDPDKSTRDWLDGTTQKDTMVSLYFPLMSMYAKYKDKVKTFQYKIEAKITSTANDVYQITRYRPVFTGQIPVCPTFECLETLIIDGKRLFTTSTSKKKVEYANVTLTPSTGTKLKPFTLDEDTTIQKVLYDPGELGSLNTMTAKIFYTYSDGKEVPSFLNTKDDLISRGPTIGLFKE